jgi:putative solute:sodium symporter small subunit
VTHPPEAHGAASPSPAGRDPEPDAHEAQNAAGGRSLAWGPGQAAQRRSAGGSDPQDDLGYRQIMARSLIRAQLGLSLVCLVFALAVTALFPMLCAVLPRLDHTEIFGLPLTLIALGAGIYPVILIIAFFYNHQANRLERQFISLVERVDRPHADD